jgi:hypothetical protein
VSAEEKARCLTIITKIKAQEQERRRRTAAYPRAAVDDYRVERGIYPGGRQPAETESVKGLNIGGSGDAFSLGRIVEIEV